jgi:selenocysteine-specific elongation factor
LVQLVLDRPIGALANDRFVLRDTSAWRTLGGGRVLDPFPPQRRRRTPERLARLRALTAAEPAATLQGLLALPPGLVDLAAFARDRNLTAVETEEALARSGALRLPGWAVGPAAWTGFREQVRTALAAFHAANPNLAGMAQSQLRTALPTRYPAPAFPAMLQALVKLGAVVVEANRVRLPEHSVRLAPEDQKLWAQIEPLLRRERFRPPRVRDEADLLRVPEPRVRSLMKLMVRLGRVEEIAHDHFFLRPVVDEMVRIAADLGRRDPAGVITAAAFRDRLDNGRKVAIQILEFFDAHGLTTRNGDLRRLRQDRLDRFADLPGA